MCPLSPGVVRLSWRSYLTAGTGACLLYLFVPPFQGSGPVMNLLGLSSVVAILAALRLHDRTGPGEWRTPWAWFAIGMALFWCGDLYTYSYRLLLHHDAPFPSIGNATYILVYPSLMAGLVMLAGAAAGATSAGRSTRRS